MGVSIGIPCVVKNNQGTYMEQFWLKLTGSFGANKRKT